MEGDRGLVITSMTVEDLALLAHGLPLTEDTRRVLTRLLEGKRVAVTAGAWEYRRYRRCAPPGIYRRYTAMARRVRELGLVRAGEGERGL